MSSLIIIIGLLLDHLISIVFNKGTMFLFISLYYIYKKNSLSFDKYLLIIGIIYGSLYLNNTLLGLILLFLYKKILILVDSFKLNSLFFNIIVSLFIYNCSFYIINSLLNNTGVSYRIFLHYNLSSLLLNVIYSIIIIFLINKLVLNNKSR